MSVASEYSGEQARLESFYEQHELYKLAHCIQLKPHYGWDGLRKLFRKRGPVALKTVDTCEMLEEQLRGEALTLNGDPVEELADVIKAVIKNLEKSRITPPSGLRRYRA